MFTENIRIPINYSLLPFLPSTLVVTKHIDLKSMMISTTIKLGRNYDIDRNSKITLSNYTALKVLKDVNNSAKIKKYLFHPLTAFTITTLTVIPLFFTSILVIKIALVLINNIGLLFLLNEARFRTLTETSNFYKRIDEVASILTISLETEYEDLDIL